MYSRWVSSLTKLGTLHLLMICSSCVQDPRGSVHPDDGSSDVARQEERLIRVIDQSFDMSDANDPRLTSSVDLVMSADRLGQRLYDSCLNELYDPDLPGQNFIEPRQVFQASSCPTVDTSNSAYLPHPPANCSQAICLSHAAMCVAHRLVEISETVSPFESRLIYSKNLKVPPQSSIANAYLLETATRWAALAGTTSGENLRSSLGIYASYLPNANHANDLPGVCAFADLDAEIFANISYNGSGSSPVASTFGALLMHPWVTSAPEAAGRALRA